MIIILKLLLENVNEKKQIWNGLKCRRNQNRHFELIQKL